MKETIEYTKPVAWDLKKGKEVIRTVTVLSRFIEIRGMYYKVCGTDSEEVGGSHLLCNIATNDWRWVKGTVIRLWIDVETEKSETT